MWELIANMMLGDAQKDMQGSGMSMGMGQNSGAQAPGQQMDYAKDGSNADAGLAATTPTATQPMTAGDMAGNVATGLLSPYTKGIEGIKSLYENPGDRQALGSVLNMISPPQKKEQYQVPYTESNMPSMTTGNLGLPASGMQGPMMPNPQARRSGLANQAVGRYY